MRASGERQRASSMSMAVEKRTDFRGRSEARIGLEPKSYSNITQ